MKNKQQDTSVQGQHGDASTGYKQVNIQEMRWATTKKARSANGIGKNCVEHGKH